MKTLLYYVTMDYALGKDVWLSAVVQRPTEKEDCTNWQRLGAIGRHPRLTYGLSRFKVVNSRAHHNQQEGRTCIAAKLFVRNDGRDIVRLHVNGHVPRRVDCPSEVPHCGIKQNGKKI